MAYYLQMDGIDDSIKTPLLTFNKVEMDMDIPSGQVGNRTYFTANPNSVVDTQIIYTEDGKDYTDFPAWDLYVNSSSTRQPDFYPALPRNTRYTLRMVGTVHLNSGNPISAISYIFSNHNIIQQLAGKIYNIKFFSNNILVAHYDMTLGNVQDQSGNGNHAILTGGTWIDEGGSVVDHPVSASASAVFSASVAVIKKRFVSATASFVTSAAATLVKKRFISASSQMITTAFASVVKDRKISASAQAAFSATVSVIKTGGAKATTAMATFNTSAAVTVVRRAFKSGSVAFVTSASVIVAKRVYVTASAAMRFTATLFQGTAIVADEVLRAERALYTTLRAERSMYIEMRGDIMTARNQNIELYAGESRHISYPSFDEQGDPLLLTGGAVELLVERRNVEVLTKALPILESSFNLSLVPADTEALSTGIYQYKATFTDGLGNVSVLAEGDLTIKR
ncbi:hypothetical protein [Paenibacillus sp. sgz302251]|uniref:hypothetical protein n=1 Tax=Paenibacillus sp. sgz302251 TaxID=3414493 RepID=UPI003C7D986B